MIPLHISSICEGHRHVTTPLRPHICSERVSVDNARGSGYIGVSRCPEDFSIELQRCQRFSSQRQDSLGSHLNHILVSTALPLQDLERPNHCQRTYPTPNALNHEVVYDRVFRHKLTCHDQFPSLSFRKSSCVDAGRNQVREKLWIEMR